MSATRDLRAAAAPGRAAPGPPPDRRARFPRLVDVDGDAAATLAALRLAFVGAGSVGLHAIDAAARLGVAALAVVDPGRVKPESLLTHPVAPADLGCGKAELAAARARAAHPGARVRAIDAPVQAAPFDALLDADVVVLASDNLACELWVAERAQRLGLPLIQASVHGPTLTAQVRALGRPDAAVPRPEGEADRPGGEGSGPPAQAPCLACAWSEREWRDHDRGAVFSCAGDGAAAPRASEAPTGSLPQLCGLAGQLAGLELVRRALGVVPATRSHLVELNGYTLRAVTSPLVHSPRCPVAHGAWLRRGTPRPVGELRVADLLALAGVADTPGAADAAEATLTLPGLAFAAAAACACPVATPFERFVPAEATVIPGRCPACGRPRRPHPFHLHREVPLAVLAPHTATPLAHLGAGAATCALLRWGERVVLLHPDATEPHP